MIAKIIQGPHLLWTGANGYKAYGITVESIGSKEQVEDQGRSRTWMINARHFMNAATPETFGQTREEFIKLFSELHQLEELALSEIKK